MTTSLYLPRSHGRYMQFHKPILKLSVSHTLAVCVIKYIIHTFVLSSFPHTLHCAHPFFFLLCTLCSSDPSCSLPFSSHPLLSLPLFITHSLSCPLEPVQCIKKGKSTQWNYIYKPQSPLLILYCQTWKWEPERAQITMLQSFFQLLCKLRL